MDSYHEDEINFGTEEANRMHAVPDPWDRAYHWITTTTGQEFCDELVYGTVGQDTLNSILRSFDININDNNRQRLVNLANSAMTRGDA
jgi:hypothetical protein